MHIEDKRAPRDAVNLRYNLEIGVAISINDDGPDNDVAEAARATADNAAAVIGRIVSVLADKGLLDRDDVQFIVGGVFAVVEDE